MSNAKRNMQWGYDRRIDVRDAWALRYWSRRLGVPYGALRTAVQKAGPALADVERELSLVRQQISGP